MSKDLNVSSDRIAEVIDECIKNAPKISAIFDDEVIKNLETAYDITNLKPIKSIVERTKKLKIDAAEPIQEAIVKVGQVLTEYSEKHNKINREY